MGLDTSHDCWHGAYSAFTRWRNKLAELAGFEMAEDIKLKGEGRIYHDLPLIDWGHIPEKSPWGEWGDAKEPDDPLVYLIVHSDCEGVIHPKEAARLMARLKELLPLCEGIDLGGHVSDLKEKTQQFIAGLELAVSRNEDVDFH